MLRTLAGLNKTFDQVEVILRLKGIVAQRLDHSMDLTGEGQRITFRLVRLQDGLDIAISPKLIGNKVADHVIATWCEYFDLDITDFSIYRV